MNNLQTRLLKVLLPMKPADDPAGVTRLLGAVLPADRTHVRRFYVHRPVESNFFLPGTTARLRDIPRLEFEAEIATRAESERAMGPLADAGFEVSADIVRGSPAEEILREASLWRADLVAVRTRSASVSDHRVGHIASALAHHATCPVLTYLAMPAGYRLRRVLIPVDFSRASRATVPWGLALADLAGAEAVLLHVIGRWVGPHGIDTRDLVEAAREELGRWLSEARSASRLPTQARVVMAETPAEGIVAAAEEGSCDLVVLSATGVSAVRAALVGSNTRQVLRTSRTPILVVPTSTRVAVEDFLARAREAEPVPA
jgi:nucleotide-binding universal stress UspA family protein